MSRRHRRCAFITAAFPFRIYPRVFFFRYQFLLNPELSSFSEPCVSVTGGPRKRARSPRGGAAPTGPAAPLPVAYNLVRLAFRASREARRRA